MHPYSPGISTIIAACGFLFIAAKQNIMLGGMRVPLKISGLNLTLLAKTEP